jgi:uncharacterized Zn finger protein
VEVEMKQCPTCKQGLIHEVRIKLNNKIAYLCDECDAFWLQKDDLVHGKEVDFWVYMQDLGLQPYWDNLDDLGTNFK